MERIYRYCLGHAAQLHGVLVHAACLMSTHAHEVITDVRGEYPKFLETFHRNLALCTKALRGWPEEVFNKRSSGAHTLLTPEAMIESIAYLIANPVEALAVRYAKDWPEVIELRLQMPMALELDYGAELARGRIAERVRQRRHQAWNKAKRTGMPFVGPRRVLRLRAANMRDSVGRLCDFRASACAEMHARGLFRRRRVAHLSHASPPTSVGSFPHSVEEFPYTSRSPTPERVMAKAVTKKTARKSPAKKRTAKKSPPKKKAAKKRTTKTAAPKKTAKKRRTKKAAPKKAAKKRMVKKAPPKKAAKKRTTKKAVKKVAKKRTSKKAALKKRAKKTSARIKKKITKAAQQAERDMEVLAKLPMLEPNGQLAEAKERLKAERKRHAAKKKKQSRKRKAKKKKK